MKKEGKFILMNRVEFTEWLTKTIFARKIELIQDHHTYEPCYDDFNGNNHFDLLRGMESGHIKRGFDEIAQNITTFPDGLIAICRHFDKVPAGIKGANIGAVCIENVGYFDMGKDEMTEEQRKSIICVNAALCKKFKLAPGINTIVYHYWYDLETGERKNGKGITKTCPGTNFFGGNTIDAAKKNFIPLIIKENRKVKK